MSSQRAFRCTWIGYFVNVCCYSSHLEPVHVFIAAGRACGMFMTRLFVVSFLARLWLGCPCDIAACCRVVCHRVMRSHLGSIFDDTQYVTAVSGCGNNWAHGHMECGPEYRESLLDKVCMCVRFESQDRPVGV